MFGVVLWSDAEDGKAVFWCEDQGDLAYFEPCGHWHDQAICFDAGDMVQFDVSVDQRLRRASNPRLVQEQAYQGLPDRLREGCAEPVGATGSAKVIPFQIARQAQNLPASPKRSRQSGGR